MTCQEIKRFIDSNGLRQDYLANILGISNSYFTMAVKGQRRFKKIHLEILNTVLIIYDKARVKIKSGA